MLRNKGSTSLFLLISMVCLAGQLALAQGGAFQPSGQNPQDDELGH